MVPLTCAQEVIRMGRNEGNSPRFCTSFAHALHQSSDAAPDVHHFAIPAGHQVTHLDHQVEGAGHVFRSCMHSVQQTAFTVMHSDSSSQGCGHTTFWKHTRPESSEVNKHVCRLPYSQRQIAHRSLPVLAFKPKVPLSIRAHLCSSQPLTLWELRTITNKTASFAINLTQLHERRL